MATVATGQGVAAAVSDISVRVGRAVRRVLGRCRGSSWNNTGGPECAVVSVARAPCGGGDDPARPAVRNCWVWLHRQPRRRSGLPWVVLQVSLATGSCGLLLLRFYFGAAMGGPCGPGGPLKGGTGVGKARK